MNYFSILVSKNPQIPYRTYKLEDRNELVRKQIPREHRGVYKVWTQIILFYFLLQIDDVLDDIVSIHLFADLTTNRLPWEDSSTLHPSCISVPPRVTWVFEPFCASGLAALQTSPTYRFDKCHIKKCRHLLFLWNPSPPK